MVQGDLIIGLSQEEVNELFPYPCDTCGDYEYCAGHFGDEQCTGYIRGNNILFGIGQCSD